ncbi:class I SAM-dependent methyltransferase [Azospirillum sp.]|uniref:class I SAM-dependent methyltransferase n=1 Tax=Azospirillum sp. TaxID=34012 RepID=UPI003D738252
MADGAGYYGEGSVSAAVYDVVEGALIDAGVSACCGDLAFYRALAAGCAGPVLEVGTGTGRVAWALAGAGHAVVGVDVSTAMLARAEAKGAALPPEVRARVRLVRQDMTRLDLGRRFPLILVPHRTFSHVTDAAGARAALEALRRHLEPGGRLVLHLYAPSPRDLVPDAAAPQILQTRDPASGETVRWSIVGKVSDLEAQTVATTVRFTVLAPDGAVRADGRETVAVRWATQPETRYLAELCGLEVEALHGDFLGGAPGPDKDQVWVLRAMP